MRRCQRQHRGTCCLLSSAWNAQIGPDLASAQSLLRALSAPRSFLPPARGILYDPEDRQLPTRLVCGGLFCLSPVSVQVSVAGELWEMRALFCLVFH